jgi:hypothetical protein
MLPPQKSLINNMSQGCSNLDSIGLNQYYRATHIFQKVKETVGVGILVKRLGDIVPFSDSPKV